jgi:hypothetical protein
MGSFYQCLEMGEGYEFDFAQYLLNEGCHILPMQQIAEQKNSSPLIWNGEGRLKTADILTLKDGKATWYEVKSKSVPGYFYMNRRWEQGITLGLLRHYEGLLAHAPVKVVVCEEETLPFPEYHPPSRRGPDGYRDYLNYLVPGPKWFVQDLDVILEKGRVQRNWSNGDGWLWPRDIMEDITDKVIPCPPQLAIPFTLLPADSEEK